MSDIIKISDRRTLSKSACLKLGKKSFMKMYEGLFDAEKVWNDISPKKKKIVDSED